MTSVAARLPAERRRTASQGRVAVVARHAPLGAALLVLAVAYAYFALRTRTFQNDEEAYVQLARIAWTDLPQSLYDTGVAYFGQGLQRLNIFAMGVAFELLPTELAFRAIRVFEALAFVSAAIPAYLLARQAGVGVRWAQAAALLAVLVPWAVVVTSFLHEPLAYPVFAWLLWAMVRCVHTGGWRNDALALGLLVVAGYARTNFLLLAVAVPVAIVLFERREGGTWRAVPRRVWVRHRLLVVAGALGTAGALVVGTGSITGSYGASLSFELGPLSEKFATQLSRLATGVALLPAAFAAAWLLRHAVRPAGRDQHALALVLVTASALLVFSTHITGVDERYLMFLAVPIAVAAVALLARRDVPWPVTAGSVALTGALVGQEFWPRPQALAQDAYQLFAFPAEAFFGRVVLNRTDQLLPGDPRVLVALAAVAAGIAAAVLLHRQATAARTAVAVLAAVLAVQAAQTGYVLDGFVSTAGTLPGVTLDRQTWLDQELDGREAGLLAQGVGNSPDFAFHWRELQFWNEGVRATALFEPTAIPLARGTETIQLRLDERTGTIAPAVELPRLLVVPRAFQGLEPVARVVARSPYQPVDLVELRGTPRAALRWAGLERDGWLLAGGAATLRAFPGGVPAGARRACLRVTVAPPPDLRRPRRVTLGEQAGLLRPGAPLTLTAPLPGLTRGAPYADVALRAAGATRYLDGRRVAVLVADTAQVGCGG